MGADGIYAAYSSISLCGKLLNINKISLLKFFIIHVFHFFDYNEENIYFYYPPLGGLVLVIKRLNF